MQLIFDNQIYVNKIAKSPRKWLNNNKQKVFDTFYDMIHDTK